MTQAIAGDTSFCMPVAQQWQAVNKSMVERLLQHAKMEVPVPAEKKKARKDFAQYHTANTTSYVDHSAVLTSNSSCWGRLWHPNRAGDFHEHCKL